MKKLEPKSNQLAASNSGKVKNLPNKAVVEKAPSPLDLGESATEGLRILQVNTDVDSSISIGSGESVGGKKRSRFMDSYRKALELSRKREEQENLERIEQIRKEEWARLEARDAYQVSRKKLQDAGLVDGEPLVQPNLMKRSALIAELVHEWPTIENDLREASKKGRETLKAANVGYGIWDRDKARAWAKSRGKLNANAGGSASPATWMGPVTGNKLKG